MKTLQGFTLSEVLITLGIIGIIAAMTLPELVEKHQKKVVVTRLKKFYSAINQAVRLSEAENGSYEYWEYPDTNNNYELNKVFYDKYLAKYLKVYEAGYFSANNTNYVLIKLADGTAFLLNYSGGFDIIFYPRASKSLDNISGNNFSFTRDRFVFAFNKAGTTEQKSYVEPYTFTWDGTRESLLSTDINKYACNKNSDGSQFCAKLIQYDNWEIKDDYPW